MVLNGMMEPSTGLTLNHKRGIDIVRLWFGETRRDLFQITETGNHDDDLRNLRSATVCPRLTITTCNATKGTSARTIVPLFSSVSIARVFP